MRKKFRLTNEIGVGIMALVISGKQADAIFNREE